MWTSEFSSERLTHWLMEVECRDILVREIHMPILYIPGDAVSRRALRLEADALT